MVRQCAVYECNQCRASLCRNERCDFAMLLPVAGVASSTRIDQLSLFLTNSLNDRQCSILIIKHQRMSNEKIEIQTTRVTMCAECCRTSCESVSLGTEV
jgi:hypothetical protein